MAAAGEPHLVRLRWFKMTNRPRFKSSDFLLVVLLAAANIAHAAYFDWSDIGGRSVLAIACIVLALKWQRFALGVAVTILSAVTVSSFAWQAPGWANQIRPGDPLQRVKELLGPPEYQFASLADAQHSLSGYAIPSPIRFRRSDPVLIYVRGEHALWVFSDGDVVKATFVGGS
jgi:hypothetical protein